MPQFSNVSLSVSNVAYSVSMSKYGAIQYSSVVLYYTHFQLGVGLIPSMTRINHPHRHRTTCPCRFQSPLWELYLVITPIMPLYHWQGILGPLDEQYTLDFMFSSRGFMSVISSSYRQILVHFTTSRIHLNIQFRHVIYLFIALSLVHI